MGERGPSLNRDDGVFMTAWSCSPIFARLTGWGCQCSVALAKHTEQGASHDKCTGQQMARGQRFSIEQHQQQGAQQRCQVGKGTDPAWIAVSQCQIPGHKGRPHRAQRQPDDEAPVTGGDLREWQGPLQQTGEQQSQQTSGQAGCRSDHGRGWWQTA